MKSLKLFVLFSVLCSNVLFNINGFPFPDDNGKIYRHHECLPSQVDGIIGSLDIVKESAKNGKAYRNDPMKNKILEKLVDNALKQCKKVPREPKQRAFMSKVRGYLPKFIKNYWPEYTPEDYEKYLTCIHRAEAIFHHRDRILNSSCRSYFSS